MNALKKSLIYSSLVLSSFSMGYFHFRANNLYESRIMSEQNISGIKKKILQKERFNKNTDELHLSLENLIDSNKSERQKEGKGLCGWVLSAIAVSYCAYKLPPTGKYNS